MPRIIEKLTYINELGESVEFSHSSIFHTNEVTGLSDVRNQIYSTNSMGQNGDTYLGGRIESRSIQIVGNIKEKDKRYIAERRRFLNHVLNPQYKAVLVYEFGEFKRVIDCTIENAPIFSKSTIFQSFTVQLLCLNPFWRTEKETRNDIALWQGDFEFPVEIIENEWMIGHREPSLIVNVFNEGDVKTGLRVEFRAIGQVTNPIFLNVNTQEFIKVNIEMQVGDILTINTGYGKKETTILRSGITMNAFRYIDPDSTYLQLEVGDNLFRYDADTNLENLEITVYHQDEYLGV